MKIQSKTFHTLVLTTEDALRLRDIFNGLYDGERGVRLVTEDAREWARQFYEVLCEVPDPDKLYGKIVTQSSFNGVQDDEVWPDSFKV